jgi:hypothetical protein
MTIIVTWSKKNQRYRSDISRVDFAEPLVTLHTLWPSEALVGACIGRESTLVGCCGEVGGGGGGRGVGSYLSARRARRQRWPVTVLAAGLLS